MLQAQCYPQECRQIRHALSALPVGLWWRLNSLANTDVVLPFFRLCYTSGSWLFCWPTRQKCTTTSHMANELNPVIWMIGCLFPDCRRASCLEFLRRVHKIILSLQAFNFLSYYVSTVLPKSSSDFLQMVRVSETDSNLTSSQLCFFWHQWFSACVCTRRDAGFVHLCADRSVFQVTLIVGHNQGN